MTASTSWNHLSPSQRASLWVEEDDAEIRALDYGIRRFKETCASQPMSRWPASRVLIASAIDGVSAEIQRRTEAVVEGRGMAGAKGWGPVFLAMDPKVLAICAITSCLNSLTMPIGHHQDYKTSLASAIMATAQAAMLECHFTILKEQAPRLKAVMERKIKRWERKSIRRAMTRVDHVLSDQWDARIRRAVGRVLVEIVVEHAGCFEVYTEREGKKEKRMLRIGEAAKAHLSQMNEHLEILSPVFQPMLVPPNPWAPGERGGYRVLSTYTTLVKPSIGAPAPADDHGDMVYGSINALQRTGWSINHLVADTMQKIWAAGGGRAGLPATDDLVPTVPFPEDGTEEEKKEWKGVTARIHQKNARMVGKRLAFLNTLDVAHRYRDREFFFPYSCDFRGRIYPIPQFLQPQGNDVARGLLTFSEAKPLGPNGMYWLRVQYANCWGVDKVSFGERVDWANQMLHDVIERFAGIEYVETFDPFDYGHLWEGADDPWQALATLYEIVCAFSYGDPAEWPCSLPINVDGSNSGLQHFSAMLRDPVGARLVNLEPGDSPSDIYADVAASVKREVEQDSRSGQMRDTTIDTMANDWLKAGIDRKLCKRGTMTFCYGVTQQGLKTALLNDGFCDWADNQFAAAQYIGKKIWAGICENITGATEVMDWLRDCAVCANKADMLIEWRTPIGFHVAHPYNDPQTERVSCLSGEVYFNVYDPTRGIRAHKQQSALPPNFVHSLDAAHLMMTVAAGTATGITHWMMIHDSFGTHACDVDHLNLTLREEFVKLYEIDILASFREQVIEQTGHDPGPPPSRGEFDLHRVLDSPYFFA